MRLLRALVAMAGAVGGSGQAALADEPAQTPPVEVMILGTYHMGNPGLDLANAKADDVTAPTRQKEIVAVVDEIARWRPTKVLIETQVPPPFTVARYREFTPAALTANRNEIWQLGFRLAHQLQHREVYGFDERPGSGEPEYFQWNRLEAYAKEKGRDQDLAKTLAYFRDNAAKFEREQKTKSIAELLIGQNDADQDRVDHGIGYYFALDYGDADNQVGAEFNSFWYMRNAKMFSKIALISEPGDRLMVLVGSGHGYWLRHFVSETPGYRNVDPVPYLKRAAKRR